MAEQERRPIILTVHPVGSPEFQRFAISDQWLRWFDGNGGWTEDEAKAVRFASSNEACHEVQRLLLLDYTQLPVKRYVAPVYLDLYCAHEIPEFEIRKWLHRVARLILDSPTYGNGPLRKSLGSITIRWSELEEITGEGSV